MVLSESAAGVLRCSIAKVLCNLLMGRTFSALHAYQVSAYRTSKTQLLHRPRVSDGRLTVLYRSNTWLLALCHLLLIAK